MLDAGYWILDAGYWILDAGWKQIQFYSFSIILYGYEKRPGYLLE